MPVRCPLLFGAFPPHRSGKGPRHSPSGNFLQLFAWNYYTKCALALQRKERPKRRCPQAHLWAAKISGDAADASPEKARPIAERRMERYEACSPLRPHFCLRCTKKPAAKQKVAMQAGRQTVTYRRQSGEGQTGNGQTQQPDRRWAYRQWWTSEGQTDNSRQAGPDKRLPDGRQTDKDQQAGGR